MRKLIRTAAYIITSVSLFGCAKAAEEGKNEANERYFRAWMEVWNKENNRDVQPTGLGIYVIEETEGTGAEVKMEGYVFADYIVTDLEGNIASYTDEKTAQQMNPDYNPAAYYGPKAISTVKGTIQAGLADALTGMKVGGRKKVIIPGWLMSYKSYDTEKGYLDNATGGANTIYDITVRDFTEDMTKYEADSVKTYMENNSIADAIQPHKDTTFFFKSLLPDPEMEEGEKFESDTVIYINYTGKLLNGLVFDTTDERLAKDEGIYSSSRAYGPMKVTWGEKYSEIKLSGSSVVSGFAMTLWEMQGYKKGIGIFSSAFGYANSGSGSSIPPYAPLLFEIEIVDQED